MKINPNYSYTEKVGERSEAVIFHDLPLIIRQGGESTSGVGSLKSLVFVTMAWTGLDFSLEESENGL